MTSARRPPLLEQIERAHPEWLEGLRAASPGEGNAAFEVRVTSGDRRPDVELGFDEREALVRVGRHETLFTWTPMEASSAAAEVVAYVSRITRADLDGAAAPAKLSALDGEQRRLLHAVDALLRERGAVSDVAVSAAALEPYAELRLLLPPERLLDVTILIAPDTLELDANGAVLRLSRADFGDRGPDWVEACTNTLVRLLADDLTVRTRRTLLGRRVGAVHVPEPGGEGQWNGELLAYRGWGRVRRFARWWSAV